MRGLKLRWNSVAPSATAGVLVIGLGLFLLGALWNNHDIVKAGAALVLTAVLGLGVVEALLNRSGR